MLCTKLVTKHAVRRACGRAAIPCATVLRLVAPILDDGERVGCRSVASDIDDGLAREVRSGVDERFAVGVKLDDEACWLRIRLGDGIRKLAHA